ncbi:hydroxyacid dehydrogenase [Caldilinea sp.]|uniref:hydroxyacid dehydrogenase n=1 Tax=Caldilinea sp. TaxID=2293560 RepID=UPI0021DE1047|nr:hydroxyacid dehydrogenase [Caldilinea sp.]GIV67798.1 MAG: dehydrogenase [Caldilinea sp.]
MSKPIIAVTIGRAHYTRIFSEAAWRALDAFAEVIHHPKEEPANKADLLALLPPADACITGWDVAPIDADVLAAAPKLRAIAHTGGSVKRFVSEAVWARNIHVTSAAPALAQDVAETTLGLIIVSVKRILPLSQHVREGGWREHPAWPAREVHSSVIGIVGASNVGRRVIELLRPFHASILLYDPYVNETEAARLGVTKVELAELARRADVISLHAPALPSTRHMIDRSLLHLMKDDAVLINTARGALIDEEALVEELAKGRFFAFLDVTDPEPPAPDSPLRRLPNVVVTPHLAGCITDCTHLGEMAVEELRRFFAGEPPLNRITPDQFGRIG